MTPPGDGPDDPWEAARARTREDVRAAFATRTADCPACGATVEADGRRCPACGASLVATRGKWRPTRRGAAIVLVVAGLGTVAIAVGIATLRDDATVQRATERSRQAALEARERRRLLALGRPRRVQGPRPSAAARLAAARSAPTTAARAATRAYRERLLDAGGAAVLADARARQPDDAPRGTSCRLTPVGPTRTAQESDPGVAANRYICIAYERRIELTRLQGRERTGVFGTPYWVVADYRTGRVTFCRLTPRAGEGATTLATVPVDPACRDPYGRRG